MTDLTRRSLLRTGAAAGFASLIGLHPWAPAAAEAGMGAAPGYLVRSAYAGRTGQDFAVRGGGRSAVMRLLSVSDVAGASAQPRLAGSEHAFVLSLAGPLDMPIEAGIQTFSHAKIGTFELFMAPVERPDADRRYEVVVDRSVGIAKASGASRRSGAA